MFYICDICDYKTTRKNDYEKHENTTKHKQKVCDAEENALKLKCKKSIENDAKIGAESVPVGADLVPYICEKCNTKI